MRVSTIKKRPDAGVRLITVALYTPMTSPVEKIYKEIFGSLPSKSGVAFERLAAIAMSLLEEGSVTHDSRLRGQFSKTLYQLDVRHKSTDGQTEMMGEAKDYSKQGAKVGRGDIQKLAGALPDLQPVNAGAFFSATGYTSPAKKYAESAASITGGKSIALYELATSTEQDEKGFIKTFVVNMHIEIPHPHQGNFVPILTDHAQQILNEHFLKDGASHFQYQLSLSEFFDEKGNLILSLGELTSTGYGCIHEDDKSAHGCYWLPRHYLNINGVFAQIHGLESLLQNSRAEQPEPPHSDFIANFLRIAGQGLSWRSGIRAVSCFFPMSFLQEDVRPPEPHGFIYRHAAIPGVYVIHRIN